MWAHSRSRVLYKHILSLFLWCLNWTLNLCIITVLLHTVNCSSALRVHYVLLSYLYSVDKYASRDDSYKVIYWWNSVRRKTAVLDLQNTILGVIKLKGNGETVPKGEIQNRLNKITESWKKNFNNLDLILLRQSQRRWHLALWIFGTSNYEVLPSSLLSVHYLPHGTCGIRILIEDCLTER